MLRDVWERWLGVGLAAVLGVATVVLALTGRLGLYLNPANSWFAVTMAVVAIGVGVVGFALPLGAEKEHDHDHGHDELGEPGSERPTQTSAPPARSSTAMSPAAVLSVVGGAVASAVVVGAWLLPPATLSVALAIDRAAAPTALFDREDAVALVSSGDTRHFGVPDWSTVFATATSPEDFVGDAVELEGFVTPHPDDPRVFLLTRLVITHCVIDAQPAAVPVASEAWATDIEVGQWVRVEGTVTQRGEDLSIHPTTITPIDEPEDPYEY